MICLFLHLLFLWRIKKYFDFKDDYNQNKYLFGILLSGRKTHADMLTFLLL